MKPQSKYLALIYQGYTDDEIEQMIAEGEQRDRRDRKQKRQEKQTWKKRPKKEED